MNFTSTAFNSPLLAPGAANYFGGGSLAGSFGSGAASNAGSLFGSMGPAMGFLGGANAVMGGIQQANLNKATQNQFDAANAMFGANFGRDILAQNFDRFRSFKDPVIAAGISVNDPRYRQASMKDNLPELAGKFGRFGAFLAG